MTIISPKISFYSVSAAKPASFSSVANAAPRFGGEIKPREAPLLLFLYALAKHPYLTVSGIIAVIGGGAFWAGAHFGKDKPEINKPVQTAPAEIPARTQQ